MTQRARVLVIDEALPFPADSGKRIRTTALLKRLTDDFDITLAYHVEGDEDPRACAEAEACGLRLLPVRRKPLVKHGLRFAWDLGRNIPYRGPYMVMAHRTQAMRRAVRDALAGDSPPDLLHVEWTPLVANVDRPWTRPIVISAHNVEADIWRRYKENEARWVHRQYIGLQHRKVHRFESEALGDVHAVTAVSEGDAETIRHISGQAHVTTVPNGVDAGYFRRAPDDPERPRELVFVGALDWRPNQDGITWFLDEVLPRIRQEAPNVELTVVGRNPPAWLAQRIEQRPGVSLHGSVPDVRPYMGRCAVFVVPLRIGGGSRLKICEALAMERAVASTTIGAEGLAVGDGVLRADAPQDLAKGVLSLLADPAARRAMATRGRRRVLATYEWDVIAPTQAQVWREALARGGEPT